MDNQFGMGLLISLKDAFSQNARRIEGGVADLDSGMSAAAKSINRSVERISGGFKMMAGGAAGMALPASFISSTLDTKRALGNLSAEGVNDLKGLEAAATRFTNQWAGIGKAEFLTSAWNLKGALSQLSDQAVGTATSMTALTAKATRGDLAPMAEAFTNSYGIFRKLNQELNDEQWFSAFSGAMTQTVNAFNTDGNKMSMALRDLGQAGSALGVPINEQLAVLGSLQTTMKGEMAGTYYRAFLNNVFEGGKKLGIAVTDQKGYLLSMPQILKNLQGRMGDLTTAANQVRLKEAFGGDEAKAALLALLETSGQLPDNIAGVGNAFRQGSSVTIDSARKVDANIAGSLGRLQNRFRNLREEIGNAQEPWAKPLVDSMNGIIGAVQKLANEYPVLVGGTMAATTALAGIVFTAGAARFALGGLQYSWVALQFSVAKARVGIIESLWAIQLAALSTNRRLKLGLMIPEVNFRQTGILKGMRQFGAGLDYGQLARGMFRGADGAARSFLGMLGGGVKSVATGGRGLLAGMFTGIKAAPGAVAGGFSGMLGMLARVGPLLASVFSLGGLLSAGAAVSSAFAAIGAGLAAVFAAAWPITLAIGLIVAGTYVLWHVMQGVWRGVMSVMRPVLSALCDSLAPVLTEIGAAFSDIGAAFSGAFGGSGMGGVLQSLGQGFGWLLARGLVPMAQLVGGVLWVGLKGVAIVVKGIAWAAKQMAHYFKVAYDLLPGFLKPAAPPKTPTTTEAIKQGVKPQIAAATKPGGPVSTSPHWFSPLPAMGRAAAAAAMTVAPVAYAAPHDLMLPTTSSMSSMSSSMSSEGPPRLRFKPSPVRRDDTGQSNAALPGTGGRQPDIAQLFANLQAAVESLADRPVEANVTTLLDGRVVYRSVKKQQCQAEVRGYSGGSH